MVLAGYESTGYKTTVVMKDSVMFPPFTIKNKDIH